MERLQIIIQETKIASSMKPPAFQSFIFIFTCSIASWLLVGCSFLGGQATPTPTLAPIPTASPSPAAPLILLLAPPESDAGMAATSAEIAGAYAASNSMQFEQRSLLNPSELPAGLTKLLILAPDPGAAALANAAPQVAVLAIGFVVENPPSNLQVLSQGETDSGAAAFVAGYAAALSAEDWRAGMLYTPASAAIADDFIAGAEYFCGACTPVAPPYVDYPQAVEASDVQNWQAAADQLLAQSVRMVYLAPELENSGAAQYLASYGALIIGSGMPPAEIAANWLASISADPVAALRQQLPLALEGQPLGVVSSLAITNANPDLLSLAKQSYIQLVINDLLSGYIALPVQ